MIESLIPKPIRTKLETRARLRAAGVTKKAKMEAARNQARAEG